MYKKLFIFLLVIAGVVSALVYYDRNRSNPWSSEVFFTALKVTFGA
jgi:hypothetical protein